MIQITSPSLEITKIKSPATQGVLAPATERSQTRRPVFKSIAVKRPELLMLKTNERSITGLPFISAIFETPLELLLGPK